jgi:hypothetical protein
LESEVRNGNGEPPAAKRQIAAFYLLSSISSRATSRHPEAALLLSRGRFPEGEGPRTGTPPVCSPFADAFQRLLTAHEARALCQSEHEEPGVCVLYLPAVRCWHFSAPQHTHSMSSITGLRSMSSLLSQEPAHPAVVFNALGVALAA